MVLIGTIPGLGPFTLTMGDGIGNLASDGSLFSIGTSDEIPGTPRLAHDAFELFFQVEVAGLRLHNVAPLHVESTIDRLPPIGSAFRLLGPPVPLVTDASVVLLITEVMNQKAEAAFGIGERDEDVVDLRDEPDARPQCPRRARVKNGYAPAAVWARALR